MKCSISYGQLLINTINKSSVEDISEDYEFNSIKEAIDNTKTRLRLLFDSQAEDDCTLNKMVMLACILTELDDTIGLVIEVNENNINVYCNM